MKIIRCLLLLCLFPLCVFAQKTLREKSLLLKRFLDQQHYQPVKWNDSAAVLLYDKWLTSLDEEKLFFTSHDIAAIEPYKLTLDDELNGNGWAFFDKTILLYKKRLQETDSMVNTILSKPLDFSRTDNLAWPFETYAASAQELFLRWQKYLKWELLRQAAEIAADTTGKVDVKIPADFAFVETGKRMHIKKIERAYIASKLSDIPNKLQDVYLDDIAWCYDPHTNYMNLSAKTEFETKMSAAELSTGMELEGNEKGDLEIGYLQPGGSAWRSGKINKGDIITKLKIDNVEKDIKELDADKIDEYLNGSSERDIEITVKTAAGETKNVKLVKEKITDDESIVKSFVLRGNKNIGYIDLPGFYSRENEEAKKMKELTFDGCANDVSKEIIKLKKDSVEGIILDLRNNGGGSMWEAMQLAGIFIDIGPVASAKEKDGKVRFLKDPNRGSIYDGPLLVLVNGASASASEFLSATLQDYKRALIVGGTTYGKGTAQIVLPMDTTATPPKDATDFVKVTGSKFYRVNGSTTQWKGVEPDILLPDVYDDDGFKEKSNLSALQPDNSRQGIFQPYSLPSVAILAEKSKARVSSNFYFTAVNNFLQWYKKRKKSRNVPLQWAGYVNEYMAANKIFKDMDVPVSHAAQLSVSNNRFDWQRINQSTAVSKEVNEAYLAKIQTDETIVEAYAVLMDWIGK